MNVALCTIECARCHVHDNWQTPQRARRASILRRARRGTSLWPMSVKSPGRSEAGSPGPTQNSGGMSGTPAAGLGGQSFPRQQAAVRHRADPGGEHGRVPEAGGQHQRVRPRFRGPAGQVRVHQRDQVTEPAPPGLVAEQPERHLRYVYRGDRAALLRRQQCRARGAAGQVGHWPAGQVQGERPHGQRVGAEGRHEAGRVLRVPPDPVGVIAGHEPGVLGRHERGYYGVCPLDTYGTECQNKRSGTWFSARGRPWQVHASGSRRSRRRAGGRGGACRDRCTWHWWPGPRRA